MKRLLEYAEDRGNQERAKFCLDNLGQPREIHDERTTRPSDDLWNELSYQERLMQLLGEEMDRVEAQEETDEDDANDSRLDPVETNQKVAGEAQQNEPPSAASPRTILHKLHEWRQLGNEPTDRESMKQSFRIINGSTANTTIEGLLSSTDCTEWEQVGMSLARPPIVYWNDSIPRVRNNRDLWAAAWLAVETECPLCVISSFLEGNDEEDTSRSMALYRSSTRAASKVLRQYCVPMLVVGSKPNVNDNVGRFLEYIRPKVIIVNSTSAVRQHVDDGTLVLHTPLILYDEVVLTNNEVVDDQVLHSHFSSSLLVESMDKEFQAIPLPRTSSFHAVCDEALKNCYRRLRRTLRRNTTFSQLQRYSDNLRKVTDDPGSILTTMVCHLRKRLEDFQVMRELSLETSAQCRFEGSEAECVRSVQKLRQRILLNDKEFPKRNHSLEDLHLYWLSQELDNHGIMPIMRCASSGLIDSCFSLQKLLDIHVDSALAQSGAINNQLSLRKLPSFVLWYRALFYLWVLPEYVVHTPPKDVGAEFGGTASAKVTQEKDFLQWLDCSSESDEKPGSSRSLYQLVHYGHLHPLLAVEFLETVRRSQDVSYRDMAARCALVLRKYKHGPLTVSEFIFWREMLRNCFASGNHKFEMLNSTSQFLEALLAKLSRGTPESS
eukprot:gb/GECG01015409.1/.p1 GENE.gb/GECG01015409.1/~~gb/GECG01015409.1/.p1  ORF type:complete len:664 (+),score=65.76 gb/GECG01015409.1/:1-1992(+)